MRSNNGKRLDTALLGAATAAVALMAALAAWAAALGDGFWPLVLVPFAVVLAVPVAALLLPSDADSDAQPPKAATSDGEPVHLPDRGAERLVTRRAS